jgi:hypothetical protein
MYKFPTRRKAKTVPPLAAGPQMIYPVLEEMTLVQGELPRSREEWRVAMALDKLGLEYRYQVPLAGGTRVRGGMVLDFLVDLPPEQIPMPVHGEYWHRGAEEERLYLAALEHIYKREPVVLWAEELKSVAMAVATIRRELSL